MALEHVRALFASQVWALLPSKFEEIEALLAARSRGERLGDDEIRARIGDGRRPQLGFWSIGDGGMTWAAAGQGYQSPAASGKRGGAVAVVGIRGVLVPRGAELIARSSGIVSAESVGQIVTAAAADAAVRSIVLDIDSPGGSVHGMPEAAAAIRAARARKPVIAVVNPLAASAAFWLASQAAEIVATPSGELGSIGVFVEHRNLAGQLAQEGVEVSVIATDEAKVRGHWAMPLSDAARADLERRVREFGSLFEQDVAAGRRVSVADVRQRYGRGLLFGAEEAVARGLADRIGTFSAALSRAAGGAATPIAASAQPATDAGAAEREAALLRARLA